MRGIHDFNEKVSVVTGAGSGIGKATAHALAAAGAEGVLVDIHRERLDKVKAELEGLGRPCHLREVDVSKRDQMEELAAWTLDRCGRVDILFNNAGVTIGGHSEDHSLEDWEWIIGINLWGMIYGMKFFLPHMIEQRSGHMVSTSSAAALMVTPGFAAYCATKSGVVGLSLALRPEMKKHNVGISVLCPGLIKTSINENARLNLRDTDTRTPEDLDIAMAKSGHAPEKVARAVLRGIRRNTPIIPVGWEAWLGWYLMRISVRATEAIMGRVLR